MGIYLVRNGAQFSFLLIGLLFADLLHKLLHLEDHLVELPAQQAYFIRGFDGGAEAVFSAV